MRNQIYLNAICALVYYHYADRSSEAKASSAFIDLLRYGRLPPNVKEKGFKHRATGEWVWKCYWDILQSAASRFFGKSWKWELDPATQTWALRNTKGAGVKILEGVFAGCPPFFPGWVEMKAALEEHLAQPLENYGLRRQRRTSRSGSLSAGRKNGGSRRIK